MKAKNFALSFFILGIFIVSFNPIFKSVGFSVSDNFSVDFSFYLIGSLTMFISGFLLAIQRNSDFRYTKHASETYVGKRG